MSRLTRDGTAELGSRDQILRHARGQGNIHFPCSADHEQDWQPYPVDPYSAICDDHTYQHTSPVRTPTRHQPQHEQHTRTSPVKLGRLLITLSVGSLECHVARTAECAREQHMKRPLPPNEQPRDLESESR